MVSETIIASKRQATETKDSLEISRRAAAAAEESIALTKMSFLVSNPPKIILRDAYCNSVNIGELIAVNYVLANIGETYGKIVGAAFSINHFKDYSGGFDAYVKRTFIKTGAVRYDLRKKMKKRCCKKIVSCTFPTPVLTASGSKG